MDIREEIEKNIKIHQNFIDQAHHYLEKNPDLDTEEFYDEYRNKSSYLHLNPIFLNTYIKCSFLQMKPIDYDDINYRCIYQDYFYNKDKNNKVDKTHFIELKDLENSCGYTLVKKLKITNDCNVDNDLKLHYENILDFYDKHPELEILDLSRLKCENFGKFIKNFFEEIRGVKIIFWNGCDEVIKNLYRIINSN